MPCCLLLVISLAASAVCQSTASSGDSDEAKQRILRSIRRLELSNYDPSVGRQELPILNDAFTQTTDRVLKEDIASALVRLDKKDDVYWSVLAKRAQEILDSNMPDPVPYDAEGKSIRGKPSPESLEWAQRHGFESEDAIYEQLLTIPGEFSFLARTGDSRGLPILRKGLQSPNYGIRALAARGLALLQDRTTIPLIIQAAQQSPSEIQGFIVARALVAFNDPTAQSAAEELVTDKNALGSTRQMVKEKGPRGVW